MAAYVETQSTVCCGTLKVHYEGDGSKTSGSHLFGFTSAPFILVHDSPIIEVAHPRSPHFGSVRLKFFWKNLQVVSET